MLSTVHFLIIACSIVRKQKRKKKIQNNDQAHRTRTILALHHKIQYIHAVQWRKHDNKQINSAPRICICGVVGKPTEEGHCPRRKRRERWIAILTKIFDHPRSIRLIVGAGFRNHPPWRTNARTAPYSFATSDVMIPYLLAYQSHPRSVRGAAEVRFLKTEGSKPRSDKKKLIWPIGVGRKSLSNLGRRTLPTYLRQGIRYPSENVGTIIIHVSMLMSAFGPRRRQEETSRWSDRRPKQLQK